MQKKTIFAFLANWIQFKTSLKYRQLIWEKLHYTCFNNSPIIKTFEVVPSPVISSYEKKEKTDDQIKTQIYLGSLWNVMSRWQIKWSCFNHRLKLNKNWKKQLKMDGTVKMRWNHIKRDTTVWNLTKPYEIEQNIQWHETVIDQMDIRTTLNNNNKKN